MVERNSIRDVLEDVLTQAVEDHRTGFEGLSELIYRSAPMQDAAPGDMTPQGAPDKPGVHKAGQGVRTTPRRKATHLISEQNLDSLGAARSKIARLLEDRLGDRPSRSDIVDKALEIVLDEFNKKGLDSTLVQKILTLSQKTS